MKTTLSIITAALVSGAAYGGSPWFDNFQQQMREQEQARIVHEQLEEIQAQQRQIRAEIYDRQLFEMNRRQEQERYLRLFIEDCE